MKLSNGSTKLYRDKIEINYENYSQIKGCAMKTICAPSYANIFMGLFERKFMHPIIKTVSILYLGFIGKFIVKLQILEKKDPQIHLIVIREYLKTHHPSPILINLDNSPPGAFYSTLLPPPKRNKSLK